VRLTACGVDSIIGTVRSSPGSQSNLSGKTAAMFRTYQQLTAPSVWVILRAAVLGRTEAAWRRPAWISIMGGGLNGAPALRAESCRIADRHERSTRCDPP
jgi:hypothetical protein